MIPVKRFLLIALGWLYACNQNVQPLPENGGPPLPAVNAARPAVRSTPPPAPPAATSAEGGTLAGTVTIAPELEEKLTGAETLYIMARRGMGGPPTAVKRLSPVEFPVSFTLTAADQMVQGTPFTGDMIIIARIDRDGNAGPPQSGDMEGIVPKATIGDTQVNVLIDKTY